MYFDFMNKKKIKFGGKIMYLVLSRDPNNLVMKVNRVITDLGKPHLIIRTLHESPTQPEPVKIVPIWKTQLVTRADQFVITQGWKATTGTTTEETTNVIKAYEAFFNPGLYKQLVEKPSLSILARSGKDIACSLSYALSNMTLGAFITIILTAIMGGISVTRAQELDEPALAIVLLVLISLSGYLIVRGLTTAQAQRNLAKVEEFGLHEGLFRDQPENLVESVRLIRLLEDEANESFFKNIIKMAIAAPKKAIRATVALVKQRLPEGSEARRNYLALLKDAYQKTK
jgi:hypothetical protein